MTKTARVLTIMSIVLFTNMFLVDFYLLQKSKEKVVEKIVSSPSQIVTALPHDNSCPTSCLAAIYNATTSAQSSPTMPASSRTTVGASLVKEYFIPLGSGSNTSDDWDNVTSAQSYVDSTQYGQIKAVTFEVSVHIPTGNETAYVRLYNATDNHPVWSSDVSLSGGTPQLLISSPITLDPGNKLYQVQMKTQLKFPAILDQARIHVKTY